MGAYTGTNIPTNGLNFNVDFASPLSRKGIRSNQLPWDTWTVGSGSATFYSQNGDGNSRLLDSNPWGQTDIVWQTLNNDATSDADGGWNSSSFSIDNTKFYRFTTWVRRKVLGNGSFYLGCRGYNSAGTNIGVLTRSGGTASTNPYFTSFGWSLNLNQWYLVVGHIWPAGSGTGSTHPDTGVWDLNGNRVSTISDFVWQTANTTALHRSYLYYSTDSTTNQQWYQPRVDICNGSEPSLSDLLKNVGNTIVNVADDSNNMTKVGDMTYSSNLNYIQAASGATSRYMTAPAGLLNGLTSWTIDFWLTRDANNSIDTFLTCGAGNNFLWFFDASNLLHYQNTAETTISFPVTNGQIFNFTATGSGGVITVYKNGVSLGTMSNTTTISVPSTFGVVFGQELDSNSGSFDSAQTFIGKYHASKFYNRVLTASEVRQLYDNNKARYGL